jgi:hypothetical protein
MGTGRPTVFGTLAEKFQPTEKNSPRELPIFGPTPLKPLPSKDQNIKDDNLNISS